MPLCVTCVSAHMTSLLLRRLGAGAFSKIELRFGRVCNGIVVGDRGPGGSRVHLEFSLCFRRRPGVEPFFWKKTKQRIVSTK